MIRITTGGKTTNHRTDEILDAVQRRFRGNGGKFFVASDKLCAGSYMVGRVYQSLGRGNGASAITDTVIVELLSLA